MNKYRLITAILLGLTTQVSLAGWQSDESSLSFTGSDLAQEFSFSASRSTNPSTLQTLSYVHNDHEEVTDIFNRNQSYEGLHFTSTTAVSNSNTLHFSSQVSRDEQYFGSVLSAGSWLVGVSAGQGKNFVKSNQAFTGVNPYFVHGGSATKFNFYGANAGYNFNNKALTYVGSSTIQSDRLEDRQANYIGIETGAFSATLMNFKRGNQTIGKGIDFGTRIDKYRLGYRQISRENGAHSKTVSIEMPTSLVRAGKFGFAVESVNNPVYREQDDLSFMLTFSGEWGKRKPLFRLDEGEEETVESTGINKMAVIGVGVVAGAVIASSGSSSKDNNEAFTAAGQTEAARRILNEVNPLSVAENREYGGLIFRNPDGSYSNTEPVTGDNDSVLIPFAVPAGTQRVALFHTHAAFDPRYDNENFSPTDINSANRANLDSYLGTPAGAFKLYDVSVRRVFLLGTINN